MSDQVFRPDIVEVVDLRVKGEPLARACPARHEEGWLCTRPAHHDGEHAAGTSGKWFAEFWD